MIVCVALTLHVPGFLPGSDRKLLVHSPTLHSPTNDMPPVLWKGGRLVLTCCVLVVQKYIRFISMELVDISLLTYSCALNTGVLGTSW